jgi:hypothetical protein
MCECSLFPIINYVKLFDGADFRFRTGLSVMFLLEQNGIFPTNFVLLSKKPSNRIRKISFQNFVISVWRGNLASYRKLDRPS